MKQVAADAEFFGDLGDGLAGAGEFDGLGFELGGVALALLGFPWADDGGGWQKF